MSRVGFIGLGNMGGFMASNLLKKGQKVVVFDVVESAVTKLQSAGAEVAKSPRELASKVEGTIVTMLPENEHVRKVYTSKDGLLIEPRPGTLFVDCSTVDPLLSKELSGVAKTVKSDFADAPVSGGVNAAREGILTFMVGCDPTIFDKVKGILELMGKAVHHCGPVGTGEAAKICNNMLLGISMIGVSEAMNLGRKMGIDPHKLAKIVNTSTGRCWSSELYNPVPGVLPNVPSSNDYKGGFGVSLMAKDLGLATNSSVATKTSTPLGKFFE